jgi:molecular chaperone GrpE (heat shock protein)
LENQVTFLQKIQNEREQEEARTKKENARLQKEKTKLEAELKKRQAETEKIKRKISSLQNDSKQVCKDYEPLINAANEKIQGIRKDLKQSLKNYTLELIDQNRKQELLEAFEVGDVFYEAFSILVDGRFP